MDNDVVVEFIVESWVRFRGVPPFLALEVVEGSCGSTLRVVGTNVAPVTVFGHLGGLSLQMCHCVSVYAKVVGIGIDIVVVL